jgi:type IV pilus assembly protein PilW
MNNFTQRHSPAARRAYRGFSLVEIMVAVAIAMFLIGGVVTVLQNIRNTSAMQTQAAQLQDAERLAMTMMAGVVEAAGYFPSPNLNTAAATMPTGGGSAFATPGAPVIIGVSNATPQGDTLTVRYAAALNDNVFNCQGGTNATVAPYDSWENTFFVQVTAGVSQLMCTTRTASTGKVLTLALVSGVTNMSVLYGVQTNGGGNGTCTDTYMTAAQVTAAADWSNVCSAVVTLTFLDPTYPNAAVQPTVTRVMALMQTAGVI